MSPHSRKRLALQLALCAGVTLSMATTAFAAMQPHPFVLTAYGSATGGKELLTGQYPAAIHQLRGSSHASLDPTAISTNRCVAFSMTKQWRAAHTACDAAVEEANAHQFDMPLWDEMSAADSDQRLAAAYSDRAVMRWMSHDELGARKDFAKALALSPDSSFVTRNLSAMKFHQAEVHTRGS